MSKVNRFNESITKEVMELVQKNYPVEDIIERIKQETESPKYKDSKIRFTSLQWEHPNIHPWDILGIHYTNCSDFYAAEVLYRALIRESFSHAKKFEEYKKLPYGAGLAWNDLGVSYEKQGKHIEALRAFERAKYFDEMYGNYDGLAKKNYEELLKFLSTQNLPGNKSSEIKTSHLNFWEKIKIYWTWPIFVVLELIIIFFFIYKTRDIAIAAFLSTIAFIIVKFPIIKEINILGSGAKTETIDLKTEGKNE